MGLWVFILLFLFAKEISKGTANGKDRTYGNDDHCCQIIFRRR